MDSVSITAPRMLSAIGVIARNDPKRDLFENAPVSAKQTLNYFQADIVAERLIAVDLTLDPHFFRSPPKLGNV